MEETFVKKVNWYKPQPQLGFLYYCVYVTFETAA